MIISFFGAGDGDRTHEPQVVFKNSYLYIAIGTISTANFNFSI